MEQEPISLPVCLGTWKLRKTEEKKREHWEDPTNERARSGQGERAQGACQTPANTGTRSHLDEAAGKTS